METLAGGRAAGIRGVGHVGLRCFDMERQIAFFRDVIGLEVTDRDDEMGLVFLSANPEQEHHHLVLATGRDVALGGRLLQQISFKCGSLESVIAYFKKFRDVGVQLDMVVSHGNAVGVYFFDPEGNRCEVYWQTGLHSHQPYARNIDLDQDPAALIEDIRTDVERSGGLSSVEAPVREWHMQQAGLGPPGAQAGQAIDDPVRGSEDVVPFGPSWETSR